MSQRSAAPMEEDRRHRVFGALAAALPDRVGGRRSSDEGPDLKVVEPTRRRRRNWQVGTVAGLILFAALFVIAGAQTLIVQQQGNLDGLNDRIETAEKDSERLRVELTELKSSDRIISEAERLGMVPAPPPVYLLPRLDDDARAAEIPPVTTPPVTAAPKASKPAKSSATPTTSASAGGTSDATTAKKPKASTPTTTAAAATGAGSGR